MSIMTEALTYFTKLYNKLSALEIKNIVKCKFCLFLKVISI